MTRPHVGLIVLLAISPLSPAADTAPTERKTNDRQIIDQLAAIHDRGAQLFNAGEHSGCYRLFQGSLQTVRLVLPKELQDAVDSGLAKAERTPDPARRAMVLHDVIEDVRKKLYPTAGPAEKLHTPRTVPSGGSDAPKPPVKKPSEEFQTSEPPMAPPVSPKTKVDVVPLPVVTIPTANPKKPMLPPESSPMLPDVLSVPPRPETEAKTAPKPVTPSGLPDLAPPPPATPAKSNKSEAPPLLVPPGK